MKNILVTGGAGFVGSHLCDRLVGKGNKIICIDNLSTGSIDNISHLIGRSDFVFVEHDVRQPVHYEVDEIYNLACPASPEQYQKNPAATIETCVLGIRNMLELARSTGCKLLQASTSEIYGDPLEHPQKETYWGNVNTMGPRSCYDEGKRCAESMMWAYRDQHHCQIRIARIFNTYGPRMQQNDGRVISNFIVQALSGSDITFYGDGQQTRSFCYVTDTVDALIRLMSSVDADTPVNVGNPNEITLLDLADIIIHKTNSSSEKIFLSAAKDDPKRRCPDITTANTVLGWHPKIDLEIGLDHTISWFKEKYSIYK
jgi:UDP-glucuronate decarboxylase